MRSVAEYIRRAQPTSGPTAGLVTNLPGGAGPYQFGIIDWPAPMRYGYTFDGNAARTIHNAEAVGAYRATAKAAAALGKAGDAARYADWADALAATINAKLRRPDGLYSDGLVGRRHADRQRGPARADVPDLLRGRARQRARCAGRQHRQPGDAAGANDVAQAARRAGAAGRDDQIVELLTDTENDGPAKILAEGGTFMWEQWDPGCATAPCSNPAENNSESFSHGWGSWGVVDMIESLLGVSVTSPGAATIRIEPPAIRRADLRRASGSAWTQRGTVRVSWKRSRAGTALDVDVPANVKAKVALPVARYKARGDGAPSFQGVKDGHAVFSVGSGRTRFSPAGRGRG